MNIGETSLPEPGRPRAIVFVDVATVASGGGAQEADVLYALSPAAPIDGQLTDRVAFRYAVDCRSPTLRIVGQTRFGADGAPRTEAVTQAAHAPAPGSFDNDIVRALCGAKPSGGYATLDQVLAHARLSAEARALADARGQHRFVTAGAAAGQAAAGGADVFIDAAGLRRTGTTVSAQIVTVFLRPLDAQSKPGNYLVSSMDFGCVDRTHATRFTTLVRPDGRALQAGMIEATPAPVAPGSLNETLLKVACENADPGLGPPHRTLAAALTVAWKDLGRPDRAR